MKVKGWGGKMKNREEWRQIVQEDKFTLSCSAERKEGRIKIYICIITMLQDGVNSSGGGVEYLHRDPALVGGDEKESLKSETVKNCRESQRTRTRERLSWQGSAAYTKDCEAIAYLRFRHLG
jgi:hypothetical protein